MVYGCQRLRAVEWARNRKQVSYLNREVLETVGHVVVHAPTLFTAMAYIIHSIMQFCPQWLNSACTLISVPGNTAIYKFASVFNVYNQRFRRSVSITTLSTYFWTNLASYVNVNDRNANDFVRPQHCCYLTLRGRLSRQQTGGYSPCPSLPILYSSPPFSPFTLLSRSPSWYIGSGPGRQTVFLLLCGLKSKQFVGRLRTTYL